MKIIYSKGTIGILFILGLTFNQFVYSSDVNLSDFDSQISYDSMSVSELKNEYSDLIAERDALVNSQVNTQSPSTNKKITERLSQINSQLSYIQKLLIAVTGVAAISALNDDGYNDNVPPVITINGDNPATVELGSTYVDSGATAMDAFHGSTPVTVSDNVDVSVVGSYTQQVV